MKIDIIIDPTHTTDEFKELGVIAENLGFSSVLTANYPSAVDPFINFTALAKETRQIKMGPVAVSPFETHPLKLSNLLFGLNQYTEGRAKISIGGGGGTLIAMGLKPDRRTMYPNMVQGVRECVQFLKKLSASEPISFKGQVFQINGPKPEWINQPCPEIYVGATKPKMLSMATELADGLIMSDVTLDRMGECISIIESSLKENKRNRDEFSISNLFAWHIKTDKEESKAEARSKLFVRGMLDHWYISTFLDDDESELVEDNFMSFAHAYTNNTDIIENVPDSIVEKLLGNLTFAGDRNDVDKVVEELLEFKRNGLDEFAIRLYKDPKDSMELIAETVIPHLD